jgi:flagellar basal-body rod protein FlgF
MNKGMYIAASGMIAKQAQVDLIAQNLANSNTAGYKKDTMSFKDYLVQTEASPDPDGRIMTDISTVTTDFSAGPVTKTGNPLDIAVDGKGLIALEGDRYTRRGDLKKNNEGYLTTSDGTKVLGAGGPILIPSDSTEISIGLEGKVSVMEPGSTVPVQIDTIRIADFGPDAIITKVGNGQFTASGPSTVSTSGVKQGYLEASNVGTVKEMIAMIEMQRGYESFQKVIQTFDNAAANVNNNLGRL